MSFQDSRNSRHVIMDRGRKSLPVDVDDVMMNKDCLNTQGTVYNHFIRTIYTACPLKIKFNSPIKKKVM